VSVGDHKRLAIVEQLLGGERCVCEITAELEMNQPLVSHHLALLRDIGLVCARGEGARTYYSLDWQRFSEGLLNFISTSRSSTATIAGRAASAADRPRRRCAPVEQTPARSRPL
jgi:DNA-binding transcriptional ArsR family regulator